MDALYKMLCEELRLSEQEVIQSLKHKGCEHQLKTILEEELEDIRAALTKVKNGNYGLCEISGELIPGELLKAVPTLKTLEDFGYFKTYYRKPLYF
jgi:RNA polymerase-binding transcription factor DksA